MAKDDKDHPDDKPRRAEWATPRLIVVNLEDAELGGGNLTFTDGTTFYS